MFLDIFPGLYLIGRLLCFIPPILLLPVVIVVCLEIYRISLRKVLPTKVYKLLLGPIALLGFFIWAIPMDMGFYEFFRAIL